MSKETVNRPVFTEHPTMTKIFRAETTKFPILVQDEPIDAKELYEAFHEDTSEALKRYDNKRFNIRGTIKSIGPDEHGKPSIQLSDASQAKSYALCVFASDRALKKLQVGTDVTICGNYLIISTALGVIMKKCELC